MIELTLEESVEEYLSGIPSFVEFSTDDPATVFYTLDGSAPNEDSIIAVGKVYLPTSGSAVTLKAIAISGGSASSVLSAKYSTDSSNLDGRRHIGEEGIVVMPYEGEATESLSYNIDGDASQLSSKDLSSLDIKASSVDSSGEQIAGKKTSLSFVNFPKEERPAPPAYSSSVNNNANFDPDAPFILMDGSTNEAFENQVVKIVNRTYSTFGPTSKFYDERLGQSEPIVTGNYVKSFYDPKTGTYTSYYWESLESRWIKSVQKIDKKRLNLSPSPSGNRFVFRWVQDRALSQLF